jgi:hypothetical protein
MIAFDAGIGFPAGIFRTQQPVFQRYLNVAMPIAFAGGAYAYPQI